MRNYDRRVVVGSTQICLPGIIKNHHRRREHPHENELLRMNEGEPPILNFACDSSSVKTSGSRTTGGVRDASTKIR